MPQSMNASTSIALKFNRATVGSSGAGPLLMYTANSSDRSSGGSHRSEEHTSELQSLMRISYAVFCFKKKICKTNTSNARIIHALTYIIIKRLNSYTSLHKLS